MENRDLIIRKCKLINNLLISEKNPKHKGYAVLNKLMLENNIIESDLFETEKDYSILYNFIKIHKEKGFKTPDEQFLFMDFFSKHPEFIPPHLNHSWRQIEKIFLFLNPQYKKELKVLNK